ncbi:unnamed protein product [Rotaria sp. Silwood1]|nr:unnamed protein product [Rotaria sp. Silwood1]
MDVIIAAVGEFIWASSCAVVNFCLSSGLSVLAVFVSFLCAILASAFYKYTTSHQHMSLDDATCALSDHDYDDLDKPITVTLPTEEPIEPSLPLIIIDESNNINDSRSLSEVDISLEGNTNGNEIDNEQTSDNILVDTVEGSEEEIQKKQIANIYRLLNDQNLINNWTTTDFVDQLKIENCIQRNVWITLGVGIVIIILGCAAGIPVAMKTNQNRESTTSTPLLGAVIFLNTMSNIPVSTVSNISMPLPTTTNSTTSSTSSASSLTMSTTAETICSTRSTTTTSTTTSSSTSTTTRTTMTTSVTTTTITMVPPNLLVNSGGDSGLVNWTQTGPATAIQDTGETINTGYNPRSGAGMFSGGYGSGGSSAGLYQIVNLFGGIHNFNAA